MTDRDLRDAHVRGVSLDRRFAIGYSAVITLAGIVLAASGYRATAQRGHRVVTLRALPELMGEEVRALSVYFDSCRALRNTSDYDRQGAVSAQDVEELLAEAAAFRERVTRWLETTQPGLTPGKGDLA